MHNDRQVIEAGVPIQFEETVPSDGGERVYVSAKFLLRDRTGKPYAVCGIATDITDSKRAEEMQAAIAREREMFAQQRAIQLAKANEALRGCLDALASVRELDDFLGQVMATMTRQLGAVSSTLRVLNFEQNTLPLELRLPRWPSDVPGRSEVSRKLEDPCRSVNNVSSFFESAECYHAYRLIRIRQYLMDMRSYLLALGVKTYIDHSFDISWPGKRPIELSFHRGAQFSSGGARDRESLRHPSQPGYSAHPISKDGQTICRPSGTKSAGW